MSYVVNRLITEPNGQGTNETYYDIIITDDLGVYSFSRWMTPSEKATYDADNSSLDSIITNYLPQARNLYTDSLLVSNISDSGLTERLDAIESALIDLIGA
jgi:hypothetical protein